jgi:hypothetical protein
MLRTSLNVCEENYGSLCFSQILDDQGPRLLIDVVHHGLMGSSPGCRYVALSYVWGQVSMLQALKSNLGQLQEDGSLKVLSNKYLLHYHRRDGGCCRARRTVFMG